MVMFFFLGSGVGQHFGGVQWGSVASWFSGALTLAAVVVALRQASNARRDAMRLQLARLVDHEVSRRRECIEALAKLWAALTGMQTELFAFTEYLKTLPDTFDPRQQHRPAPRGVEQTWGMEIREEVRRFSSEWQNRVEPPLFVALLVLRGTPLESAVEEINEKIEEIKTQEMEPIREALNDGRRPNTDSAMSKWNDIIARRTEHLRYASECFNLTREDAETSVRGKRKR
ncbi:hypothetical protein A5641_02480 [Mycobacterium sp. 1554424.7]|nr:hypothetical protein A5641_02480 [Mycobacterium sp. 1554424.7]